jgi:hypothetical protein
VHPIEWLRLLAESPPGDERGFAVEAASALGALASFDSAAGGRGRLPGGSGAGTLVVACRRLLAAHPACGRLWWAASRILLADDAAEESRLVVAELSDRRADERLAAALSDALGGRAPARVYGTTGARAAVRAALGPPHALPRGRAVLVVASAAGPSGVLAPAGTGPALRRARGGKGSVVAVLGRGVLLPGRLYDAAARLAGASGGPGEPARPRGRAVAAVAVEHVDAALLDAVAGEEGAVGPDWLASAPSRPVADELVALGRAARDSPA